MVSIKGSLLMNKMTKDVVQAGKKGTKQACDNWNLSGNVHLLKQTVVVHLSAKEAKEKNNSGNVTGIIPTGDAIVFRTTMQRHVDHFKTVAKETEESTSALFNKQYDVPKSKRQYERPTR